MISDWINAFRHFGLNPANRLHPGARHADTADAVGAMMQNEAARQQRDSYYFAGGSGPGDPRLKQTSMVYRHLSEPCFISQDKASDGSLLLKKFDV
jgi:hypothetical protein